MLKFKFSIGDCHNYNWAAARFEVSAIWVLHQLQSVLCTGTKRVCRCVKLQGKYGAGLVYNFKQNQN